MTRLPLRVRLVAGFAVAMLVVLVAAGAFVFWRVQYALDHRLDQDLQTQSSDLRQAAAHLPPRAALASLRDEARDTQLLTRGGDVLASGPGVARPLLTPAQAGRAARAPLRTGHGYLFSRPGRHQRILAVPVPGRGADVAVSAVRLDQRDEALRELLAQLAIANLLALAIASFVGYRLARAALNPVERYRAQAEQIARGATGVRLDVPTGPAGDEITRLATTLNTMLDAQERASERQRQFVDDASHELRTPLAALNAEVDLALRKPRTAAEHEQTLRRISGATGELIELAETLLTLGALGSSTPEAAAVPVDRPLAQAARRARAQLTTERGIHVDAADDLVVHADEALLNRALGNLVDNAARYGDGDITLTAADEPGHAILLAVHDQGPGMPADFLPHAAERFRQHAAARHTHGAGLGLALVDAIVTAHGGQLRICSAGHHHAQSTADAQLAGIPCAHPNTGTTITLLLPAAPAETPDPSPEALLHR